MKDDKAKELKWHCDREAEFLIPLPSGREIRLHTPRMLTKEDWLMFEEILELWSKAMVMPPDIQSRYVSYKKSDT